MAERKPLPLRYWEKVLLLPRAAGGHWLWTGATTRAGYGVIHVGGQTKYAHRLMLDLLGERDGRTANHYCPIRRCVLHVYQGSQSDNLLDASFAGRLKHRRYLRGSAHPSTIYPFSTVQAARRMRASGATLREIGFRLGVKPTTVQKWIARRIRVAS
jgi:hypothetical protein